DESEVFVSPNVIGVDSHGDYVLIAGTCARCAKVMFPLRTLCVHCQSPEPVSVPLGTGGVVYSYTVIRQAAPGFSVPYVLASVDLTSGVRIIGQVAAAPNEITIGTAVEL